MTLLDNLYSIVSRTEQEGLPHYRVRINPQWPIYRAHFPGHPITPGVCIVQMVQELLCDTLRRPLSLRKAKNVKYLAIVSPTQVEELTVAFTKLEPQEDGTLKVQAQVADQETTYTKLSLTFA